MENSAVMSVAILVMLVLSRLTRSKVSARVRYGGWMIVAVGLLLPIRPVLWTINIPDTVGPTITESVARTAVQPTLAYTPTVPAETYPVYGESLHSFNEYMAVYDTFNGYEASYTVPYYAAPLEAVEALSLAAVLQTALPVVWGVGVLLFLSICITRHIWFMKKIRRRGRASMCIRAYEILSGICREVNVKRIPRLCVSPLTATPIVLGLFRPLLVLPEEAEEHTDDADLTRLRLMLLHEVLHIKRGDNWVRLLSLVATAAHWFNPLAHLMNRAVCTEAELACDEAVLHYAGDKARLEYGRTIFITAKRVRLLSVFASAMSGEGRSLKRRLTNIIERKHTRRGLALACAVLLIGGVLLAGMLSYESRETGDDGFTEDISWQGDGEVLETGRFADEAGDSDDTGNGTSPGETDNEPPHITNPIILEPTNELILYVPGNDFSYNRFVSAIDTFRNQYPDVTVTVEWVGDTNDWDWENEAYVQRVSTELMAGMGPDVIFTNLFKDPHKTMESGMFLNLSPFWHRDPDFAHREHLNSVVMDAGLYRGRRYIIPLSYTFPLMIGERGMLENVGFDIERNNDIFSFLNGLTAAESYMRENPLYRLPVDLQRMKIREGFSVMPFVDFERGIVLPDEAVVRAFSEAFKPFWGQEIITTEDFWINTNPDTRLINGRMLLHLDLVMQLQSLWTYSRLVLFGYEPAVTALRNHHGELYANVRQSVAINANTQNYANAWNFIKILLSSNTQYGRIGHDASWGLGGGMPVNRIALQRQIYEMLVIGTGLGSVEGYINLQALTDEDRQVFLDLLNGISAAYLPNHTVGNFYTEAMELYFQGRQSLDDAMEELGRRLRIYLSE
jgi:beta-lactamase regulating signal transducer with metallopeptidase domain